MLEMIYVFITHRRSAFETCVIDNELRVDDTGKFAHCCHVEIETFAHSHDIHNNCFDRSLLRERDTQSIIHTKTKTRAKTIIDATETNPLFSDKQIYARSLLLTSLFPRAS